MFKGKKEVRERILVLDAEYFRKRNLPLSNLFGILIFFCFTNRSIIKIGSLSEFVLHVAGCLTGMDYLNARV